MDEKPFSLSQDVLKVLSVDTRVEILKALNERQMTASELSRKLGKHVTTITEHLSHLNKAGLIERFEIAGKKLIYYKLTRHGKSIVHPKNYTNIVLMLSISLLVIIAGWFLIPTLLNGSKNFIINNAANGPGNFVTNNTANSNVPTNPTGSGTVPEIPTGSGNVPVNPPDYGTGTGNPPSSGTSPVIDYGTLTLMVTDKFDLNNVTSINIVIGAVDVHMATNDTNDTDSGWITVVNTSKSFNLIELIGVEELLGESNLTLGKYTQIRLEITNASIAINGTEQDLKIPSQEIKLVHPFAIEANETTTLVLDFVAADSIVQQGKNYALKPTIKITEK